MGRPDSTMDPSYRDPVWRGRMVAVIIVSDRKRKREQMSENQWSSAGGAGGSRDSVGGRRPTIALWFALGLIGILVYQSFFGRLSSNGMGRAHPAVGRRVEDFRLQSLTGDSAEVGLNELRHRVTVVDFWGTWCPPCRIAFPRLMQLKSTMAVHPEFQLLMVSCAETPGEGRQVLAEQTRRFLTDQESDTATLWDPGSATRRSVATLLKRPGMVYPTTLLIDQDLVVRGVWVGFMDGYEEDILSAARLLLRK